MSKRQEQIQAAAEDMGLTLKDNGDTIQATLRQIDELMDRVLDLHIMEVAESLTDEEKAIVWIEEENGEVVMDLGPYIRALGRKLLLGGR